jgi:hypothetical protein
LGSILLNFPSLLYYSVIFIFISDFYLYQFDENTLTRFGNKDITHQNQLEAQIFRQQKIRRKIKKRRQQNLRGKSAKNRKIK